MKKWVRMKSILLSPPAIIQIDTIITVFAIILLLLFFFYSYTSNRLALLNVANYTWNLKNKLKQNRTLVHTADIYTGTVYGLSYINSEFY